MDQETLETFKAITHASDETASFYLSAADGDAQRAMDMFFAEQASSSAAPAQAPGPSSPPLSPRTQQNPAHGNGASTSAGSTPRGAAQEDAAPRGGGPMRLLMRAVNKAFRLLRGAARSVVTIILPQTWLHAAQVFVQQLLHPSAPMPGTEQSLNAALQEQHGRVALQFLDASWREAVGTAMRQQRCLLVYLHAPEHEDTPAFVRQVLQDDSLSAFLQQRVLLWGATATSASGYEVSQLLRAPRYPYLAVLHPAAAGGAGGAQGSAQLQLLSTLAGPCTAAQVRSEVTRATGAVQRRTQHTQARAADLTAARSERQEQDAALAESMAADRARQATAAAAAAAEEQRQQQQRDDEQAQRQAEEDAATAAQQQQDHIAARRAEKAASLPPEAPRGSPGGLVRVRLPNGATAQRRFAPDATLASVYDWVDSLEDFAAWDYALTSTYPRRELERGEETVEAAGLMPNAALLAISRDD